MDPFNLYESYLEIYEQSTPNPSDAYREALRRLSPKHLEQLQQKIKLEKDLKARSQQKEDLEYIIDYLIDEGYTDSYESALAILETMSDQWFVELIESAKDQSDKQIDKGVKTTYKAQNVLDNLHQGRSRGLKRIVGSERDAKVERMRGRLKTRRADLFAERGRREDEKMAKLKALLGL
jgi:hypothetical protein